MANRILTALKGEVKTFYRNKSTLFWTIAFPLVLIVLFGAGVAERFDESLRELRIGKVLDVYVDLPRA